MGSHDITIRPYNIINMSLAISMRSLAYLASLSPSHDDDNLTSIRGLQYVRTNSLAPFSFSPNRSSQAKSGAV
jgi:hypothetical protein